MPPGGAPRPEVPINAVLFRTVGLLGLSNIFMTFAWYAHLRNLADRPWWVAALASWGIALFEYLLQVPANRIGYTALSLGQLKILQEAITLTVFVPFAIFYMKRRSSSTTSTRRSASWARSTSSSGTRRAEARPRLPRAAGLDLFLPRRRTPRNPVSLRSG